MTELININNIKIVSANRRLIPGTGRMVNNPEYTAFKEHLMAMTRKEKLQPRYRIVIKVTCYQDADNVIKPVLDALQKRGVIDDDKNVRFIEVEKTIGKRGAPGKIHVMGEGGYR